MHNLDNQTIQLALVAAVALALLIQAIVLLAALIALRKLAKSIRQEIEDLRTAVMPIIENIRPVIETTRSLLVRVAPKIEETTADLAAISHSLRKQVADLQVAGDEIVGRARSQASRVDHMFSNVLDVVERAGTFMSETVTKPMRQVSALLASAKAVMESLRSTNGAARSRTNGASGEDDLFV
jgi:uncharacterized protein YoxC